LRGWGVEDGAGFEGSACGGWLQGCLLIFLHALCPFNSQLLCPASLPSQARLKYLLGALVIAHVACFAVSFILINSSLSYIQQIDFAGAQLGGAGVGMFVRLISTNVSFYQLVLHVLSACCPHHSLPTFNNLICRAGQAARISFSALTDVRNIQYAVSGWAGVVHGLAWFRQRRAVHACPPAQLQHAALTLCPQHSAVAAS